MNTNEEKERTKELPSIADKIQQILTFLEHADVSQWQGMNVFEAGDADTLYGILNTAFEQVVAEDRIKEKALLVEKIEKIKKGNVIWDGVRNYIDCYNKALSDVLSLLKND
jgi:hypothetical protein